MVTPEEQNDSIQSTLQCWFSNLERVVIVGIGNPFRRDDFVGVKIVRNLKNFVSERFFLIEAETVPESYLDSIISFNPTHILVIDAGIINKEPGSSKLIDHNQLIRKSSVSTHSLPLGVFCDYLVKTIGAKISLLIIQPKDTHFGEGITQKLEQTVKNLTNILLMIIS